MKFKHKFVFGVFMTLLAVKVNATQPSCDNVVGTWINELGSKMVIKSIDESDMIQGTYVSPSGGGSMSYPLVGWVNHSPSMRPYNNAHVISFSVRWGKIGSITAWTGTCTTKDGTPTIKTIWNLARSNSQFDWDHILTNSDTFTPAPAK